MTRFTTEIRHQAAAIFAALLVSTTFVGAAVGPAHAVQAPVAAAQHSGQAVA